MMNAFYAATFDDDISVIERLNEMFTLLAEKPRNQSEDWSA
jgi:hypothetical protein